MAATRATMALALMGLALMQSVSGHEYVHPKSQLRAENLVVRIDPGITLTTNVSAFTEQRQPVEVTWSGVSEPSTQDMIAVYAPANAVPWKTLPVQFMACSALDDNHLRTGAGSGVFKLINLRNAYKFVLLRGGVIHPRLVAQSQVISNSVRMRPTGGHIALHEDQRSVVVQWVSSSPTPQQVQWLPGHHGNATRYRFTATSSSVTYRVNQMCGYPANGSGWMHPGYTHSALIPGTTLTPGQRVAYHYGKDGSGWSKQHSFLAPIGPGVSALKHLSHPLLPSLIEQASGRSLQGMSSRQQPQQLQGRKDTEAALVFLAFNDVAMTNPLLFNNPGRGLSFAPDYGENSSTLSTRLGSGAEAGAHLALMVGDLAYAMGYSADWDVFGDQFEDSFTQWPMAVGTGNHERDWPGTGDAFGNTARDSGGECNVPFTYRWYTPANAKLDPRTSYYSFSQGPVHFLVLDSETPSDPDSPQGRFVAADLAALDRNVTPWVVVALHRMMVAPATFRRKWIGDVDVMERLQADYEELFRTHKVDVVISGHEHAYARTCPIFKNACLDAAMPELEAPADEPLQTCTDGWRHRLSAFSSWAMGMLEQLGRELLAGILRVGRAGGPAAGKKARHHFKAGAGGPVYVLAGHAGAGFTHGFPAELPEWVEHSRQDINGYLRFSATANTLLMEAVVSQDGSIMDTMTLHLQ